MSREKIFVLEMVGIHSRCICGISFNRAELEQSLNDARKDASESLVNVRSHDMDGYHSFEISEHSLGPRKVSDKLRFPSVEGVVV